MAVTSHIYIFSLSSKTYPLSAKCLCQSLRLGLGGLVVIVIRLQINKTCMYMYVCMYVVKFPTVCPNEDEVVTILAPCLSLTSAPQLLVAFCTAMLCFVAWILFREPC